MALARTIKSALETWLRLQGLQICICVSAIAFGCAAFLTTTSVARTPLSSPGEPKRESPAPLTLRTRIPLPGVYGRMDHYGWDSKRGILFVSALGNNTVEVVDQWKRVRTIDGLEHPQATVYLPGVDRIAVSSQSGKLRFYDAASYALIKTLDFGAEADADNMRYDAVNKLLYVGYGRGRSGALAAIDPISMERRQEFRLGSHPESFQLETNGPRIFVNLPDQEVIAAIDRRSGAVTKWQIAGDVNSHTLAFDEANHRLFTAALQPGGLRVVDSDSGQLVAELPAVPGVDDLWFDAPRKRIYATGAGAIDVFQQDDRNSYSLLRHVDVGSGAGSTSLYLRSRTQESLFMSWPNMLPQGGSEVLLFYVND